MFRECPNIAATASQGGTYFIPVTLANRGSDLLVREVETFRMAIRAVRRATPFHIDAWVVLPHYMHCIWTLPEADADFFRPHKPTMKLCHPAWENADRGGGMRCAFPPYAYDACWRIDGGVEKG
jgi:hypothetical protein